MWIAGVLGRLLLVLLAIPIGGVLLLIGYVFVSSHWDIFQRSYPMAVSIRLEIDGRPLQLDRIVRCDPHRELSGDISLIFRTDYRLDRSDIGLRFDDGSGLLVLPPFTPDICWPHGKSMHLDSLDRMIWLDDAVRPTIAEVYNRPKAGGQPVSARLRFLGMDVTPAPSGSADPEPVMASIENRDRSDRNDVHAYFSGVEATRVTEQTVFQHPWIKAAISRHPGEVVQITHPRNALWGALWQAFSPRNSGAATFATRIKDRSLHPYPSEQGVIVMYPSSHLWSSPCTVAPATSVVTPPANPGPTSPLPIDPDALTDLKLSPEQNDTLDCAHHTYSFTSIEVGGTRVALDATSVYTLIFDPTQNALIAFRADGGEAFLDLVLPKQDLRRSGALAGADFVCALIWVDGAGS